MPSTITITVSRDQPATSVRLRGPQNFRYVHSDDVRVELVGASDSPERSPKWRSKNYETCCLDDPKASKNAAQKASQETHR